MSYSYSVERPWLFTEEGSTALLKVRDNALALIRDAGAFTAMRPFKGVGVGDTWKMLAILDRLVEMGDVRRVFDDCWSQDAVYAGKRS